MLTSPEKAHVIIIVFPILYATTIATNQCDFRGSNGTCLNILEGDSAALLPFQHLILHIGCQFLIQLLPLRQHLNGIWACRHHLVIFFLFHCLFAFINNVVNYVNTAINLLVLTFNRRNRLTLFSTTPNSNNLILRACLNNCARPIIHLINICIIFNCTVFLKKRHCYFMFSLS